jgi:hypothetical protein
MRDKKLGSAMEGRMDVDIKELEECMRFLQKINKSNIYDIVWRRGSEVLKPTKEQLDGFSFMGLSNKDFPSVMGWMPDGLGIRVSTITLSKRKD